MLIVGGLFEYPGADRRPNQTDYQTYDELHFSSNYPRLSCADQLSEFCILDISGQWSLGVTLGLRLLFPPTKTREELLMWFGGRGGRRRRRTEGCTDNFLS